jgi:hypothetical protein
MEASIEKILCIGVTKTRFDLFDDVKLMLSSGSVIEGCIVEIEDWGVVIETVDGEQKGIHVNDIVDYVN